MLLTLALVVLFAAIMTFFAQEFIAGVKKIFSYKWLLLLLPIALASWAAYTFEFIATAVILYYREVLLMLISLIQSVIPFADGANSLAMILVLTLVSVGPVAIADFILRRRSYVGFKYTYITSTLVWIFSALTLVVM